MKKNSAKPYLIAAAALLAAGAVYVLTRGSSAPLPASVEKAPALSGPSFTPKMGEMPKKISLTDFAGKVVLVDFWATWCEPCQEEIPGLVKLDRELEPKGFTILGVSMDEEGAKAVRRFVKDQPIPYPIILNGAENPPPGWTVPGLPTAYLIGRDGTILRRWFGEKDPDELRAAVDAALAAK
ncbi:MAG: TlpA family protein disulfide reductase [Elusimicrobia bacterium]|nr:TlpA family protein disulfide reductase [Elusimicrobiota bacterium]